MNNVVSDRIKKAIEKSGYSFIELEKRTGVSKSALQRYSQGVTTKVPVDVVNAIGGATGISPFYLIGWGDDPNYFPLKISKINRSLYILLYVVAWDYLLKKISKTI